MDNHNVISISYNIDELDSEMQKWTLLPFDLRMRSNDECMRRYGCTNIDLYNRVKAYLLNVKPMEGDLDTLVQESANVKEVDDHYFSDMEDYDAKCQYTAELNQSPYIALLNPKEIYTMDELNSAYMKFINLNDKDKRLSDSYSLCIWGFNVFNMFLIIRNKKATNHAEDNEDMNDGAYGDLAPQTRRDFMVTYENLVEDSTNLSITTNDTFGLLKYKLKMCDLSMPLSETIQFASLSNAVNKHHDDYLDALAYVVPYYTNKEKSVIKYGREEVTNNNYSKLVQESIRNYKIDPSDSNKAILEDLGIPADAIDIFKDRLYEVCRDRQKRYLESYAPQIIDVSNIPVDRADIIRESTHQMRNLYKEKNLYPVYIVLSYTDTFFGHVIRKIKKSTYTHAAICLDSNLKEMITFKFDKSTGENGITIEDLDFYLKKSDESLISVLCVFIDRGTKAAINDALNNFVANKEKTKYGFGNLFNILINRSVKDDPNKLIMVCSQFVDSILKMAKININKGKTSNLVIPQDFVNIKHPKLFKLYEGFVKNYDEREVESKIKMLLKEVGRKNMIYTDLMDEMNESSNLIDLFKSAYITDNEKANLIMDEARELLTPEAVIVERKLPITIKDDGTISISLYKSLEQEYQEAHRIIYAATDNNLNTLKHEMARLFYINTVLEKKLSKMDKSSPNYKISTDLRARVINDFDKVSKTVFEKDKNFDFNKYMKRSEYSNDSIDIDGNVLKYSGKLIKKFITKG